MNRCVCSCNCKGIGFVSESVLQNRAGNYAEFPNFRQERVASVYAATRHVSYKLHDKSVNIHRPASGKLSIARGMSTERTVRSNLRHLTKCQKRRLKIITTKR